MNPKRLVAGALVLAGLIAGCTTKDDGMEWTVESPDGALAISLTLNDSGELSYAVTRDGAPVLAPSRLGIETSNGSLAAGLTLVGASDPITIEEHYELPHGKQRSLHSHGNERAVTFAGRSGETIDVVLRAHDDGVAFRYRSPNQSGIGVRITDELTQFAFAEPGKKWSLPHQVPALHAPAYENAYVDGVAIGHTAPIPGWLFPSLFETGDSWVLLTESDVDGTYSAGYLGPHPDGLTYEMSFPQPNEGLGIGDHRPINDGPWQTPWRVILVSGELGGVFESNLVRDVARPTALDDTSWIEPGRVAWSWWADHDSPQDPDKLIAFIDFAAEIGWEHTLIDANWNLIPDVELQRVLAHAAARDIGVFLWYNSGGPNNTVTEQPRDRMYDPEVRRSEMAQLAAWGIKGIKVDFFHSDKQAGMRHYLDIIEDAAAVGLMVNFHGSTIPRGWDRTWPHLMTMEGVRGAEQYDFVASYPEEAPWHNVILALTRNVVGPMDYTPVTFSDVTFPHVTTNAHELALSVVFESALHHFADSAESYRSQPAKVIDFLRNVPSVWDETRFIDGYPGDYIVVARRHGATWYLAGINGLAVMRTVTLDLAALGIGASLRVIGDGTTPRTFAIVDQPATASVEITMAPFGGFAAVTGQQT